MLDQGIKICTTCKKVWPLSRFGPSPRTYDKRHGTCKVCRAAHTAYMNWKNSPMTSEERAQQRFNRRLRQRGLKRCNMCGQVKRRNTEFASDGQQRRDGTFGASALCKRCNVEATRRWNKEHPEIISQRNNWRSLHGRPKDQEQFIIWTRAIVNDPCSYCGRASTAFDHIDALSRGGSPEWDNITRACQPCNSRKRAHSLLQALLHFDFA